MACQILCQDIEKPRPSSYVVGSIRIHGYPSSSIEIVNGGNVCSASLDPYTVEQLIMILLEENRGELLGRPGELASYLLMLLRDTVHKWLRDTDRELSSLRQLLRIAERNKRLIEEVEKDIERIMQSDMDDNDKNLAIARLREKAYSLYVSVDGEHLHPDRAVERIREEIKELEQKHTRLSIAARALMHAWRALTHPNITDLEKQYIERE